MKTLLCASLLFGASTHLHAQAILETGAITGATATAGASAGKATGKGAASVFGGIEKTLKIVGNSQRASSAPKSETALPQKPVEPVKLPDVAQITPGMSREDLLLKFGNPSQKMTIPEGSHLTERFRYDVNKETVRVVLEDGKVKEVAAIHPDPLPKTN